MPTVFAQIIQFFAPLVRHLLFGAAVKSAGKGALRKSPFRAYKPNLLVSGIVIGGINAINLAVMIIFNRKTSPAIISAGAVTIVTAFFVLRGIRSKSVLRERLILFAVYVVFLVVFACCIMLAEWWWLAWIAKFALELLLCYAIMITRKSKADAAQSRIVAFVSKLFGIKPDGRLAKLLSRFDPLY